MPPRRYENQLLVGAGNYRIAIMSTYVFLNIPARGHINPTLPIVRELSARGANVIYFLPEPFRELVEAIGGRGAFRNWG